MTDIRLDKETHTYTVDGVVKPSVTQIIDVLTDFTGVPSAVMERKRSIGIAAHKACELHDQGILDESTVHPAVSPYLGAYKKFKDESGFRVFKNEVVVYNPVHDYCGTVDLVGELNGKGAVIDLKCTSEIYSYVGVQLAAYKDAIQDNFPEFERDPLRYALQLKPDGTYRIKKFDDAFDMIVFLGCYQIYKWRQRHE